MRTIKKVVTKTTKREQKVTPSTGALSLLPRILLHLKKFVRNITAGGMVLNQNFKEFIQSLDDNNVRYLVSGCREFVVHL
jgi:hypothetical protein